MSLLCQSFAFHLSVISSSRHSGDRTCGAEVAGTPWADNATVTKPARPQLGVCIQVGEGLDESL